jgi:hypothetical protein
VKRFDSRVFIGEPWPIKAAGMSDVVMVVTVVATQSSNQSAARGRVSANAGNKPVA